VELFAGRVERTLLLFLRFPGVNQRATVVVNSIIENLRWFLSERGVVVQVANDLSSPYPEVVDVFLNCLRR
jgi:hypothetical protein